MLENISYRNHTADFAPKVFIRLGIFCLLIYTQNVLAGNICYGGLSVTGLEPQVEFGKALVKKSQLEYVKTDMKDFCKRNMMLRFLNTQNAAPEDGLFMYINKLEQIVNLKAPKITNASGMWITSLLSTDLARSEAMETAIEYLKSNISPEPSLKSLFSVSEPAGKDDIEFIKSNLNNAQRITVPNLENGSFKTKIIKTIACADVSISNTSECARALDVLQERMAPASFPPIADLKLWTKVLGSTEYDEGLRLAASKIVKRIEDKEKNEETANIFDDLRSSFQKAGMSFQNADEATIDILGLISSGGPNTVKRLRDAGPLRQRGNALALISSSLSYLDYQKMKVGKPSYSYPPNVKTECDNAKPYHFWMSAYMARILTRDHGFSQDAAAQAAFIAAKGYQVNRSIGNGRANSASIFGRNSYDPVHQIVRTDLAFSAAGAVFGASKNISIKSLNVDTAIAKLIEEGAVARPLDSEERSNIGQVETYLRFNKLFSPNSAFENIQEQIK